MTRTHGLKLTAGMEPAWCTANYHSLLSPKFLSSSLPRRGEATKIFHKERTVGGSWHDIFIGERHPVFRHLVSMHFMNCTTKQGVKIWQGDAAKYPYLGDYPLVEGSEQDSPFSMQSIHISLHKFPLSWIQCRSNWYYTCWENHTHVPISWMHVIICTSSLYCSNISTSCLSFPLIQTSSSLTQHLWAIKGWWSLAVWHQMTRQWFI